ARVAAVNRPAVGLETLDPGALEALDRQVDAERQLPDELRGGREGLQRRVRLDDAEQRGGPGGAEHGGGGSPAAAPPARSTGPATTPSMAMPRGTRPDRYISQPRISPFPTPTTQPGPSRKVQSWIAPATGRAAT